MALQGLGTVASPYLISSDSDLREVKNNLSASYKQTTDITMSATPFIPIGNSSTPFTGTYDGSGYKITNLVINTATNRVAMFGQTTGVTGTRVRISNIQFENPQITYTGSSLWVAVVVGLGTAYTQIVNIAINGGSITATTGTTVASIAGELQGSGNLIQDIIVNGTSVSGNSQTGSALGAMANTTVKRVLIFPSSVKQAGVDITLFSYTASSTTSDHIGGTHVGNPSGGNLVAKTMTLVQGKTLSTYTSGTGWTPVSPFTLGQNDTINMIDGSLPYVTFAGINPSKAIGLSTEVDLDLVRNNLGFYFKLLNDITLTTAITSFVIAGTFSGDFNGNGYSIKDINCSSSTQSYISVFEIISGSVYKLGIDWRQVNGSSSTSTVTLIAKTLSSGAKVTEVSAINRGAFIGNNAFGFFNSISNSVTVENCFGKTAFGNTANTFNVTLRLFTNATTSYTSTIFRHNVMHVVNMNYDSGNPLYPFVNNTSITGSGNDFSSNVFYLEGKDGVNITVNTAGNGVRVPTIGEYQSSTVLSNFGSGFDTTNVWKVADGQSDPMLKTFIKIVLKIEQRIVDSYSKVMKSVTSKFKKHLNNVKSFSKPIKSIVDKFKSRLQDILSFSKPMINTMDKLKRKSLSILSFSKGYISKLTNTKKANKKTLNFSGKVKSSIISEKLRKRLENIKSFSKNVFSKTSKTKKSYKSIKGFSSKFTTKISKINNAIRNTKTYVSPITTNVSKYIIRKYQIIAKSFTGKMTSNTLVSMLTKAYRTVESYTKPMIGVVNRFSNIYKFTTMILKSHANAIVSSVSRTVKVKLFLKSFTKNFMTSIITNRIIAQFANVMAIVKHRFNQVKLFKRENQTDTDLKKHRTIINKKDDGGEG